MHVSLPRRQQRFGSSMQYLLWICFGLLAIAPWQLIRGQDGQDEGAVNIIESNDVEEFTNRKRTQESDELSTSNTHKKTYASHRSNSSNRIDPLTPLFRSQNPNQAPSPGMFPPSGDVTAVTPSQIAPQYQFGPAPGDGYSQGKPTRGQALGAQGKFGVLTGPAIGRKRTLTPAEFMPYSLINDNLFFGDIRFFTDYSKGWGGNFGGGYRRYVSQFDRILGVNAYFDYDSTSGATFRQVGLGVESLGKYYDIRANGYFPTGPSVEQVSLSNINDTQKFVGHLLLVDQLRVTLNALHGFDTEIGFPIPGRVPESIDLKFFGGGYWYESNNIDAFAGWKGRMQATVLPGIDLQLQVANDPQFKTTVMFGASWTFGGYKDSTGERPTQYARMTTPVLRQYNIVVGEKDEVLKDVVVINPETGDPYIFEHVATDATGPTYNGTVEHPFTTITDAQNVANKDIIFVHGNSVFDGVSVTLQENVRLLGESSGVNYTVDTPAGSLLLPHPTPGTSVRPLFENLPGNGVTLVSNSEFSGFQIGTTTSGSGAAGVSIIGDSVSNVLLRENIVYSYTDDAVLLTSTGGTISFQGNVINQTGANSSINAFHVDGAVGTVLFTEDPPLTPQGTVTPGVINNTGGTAVLVENTQSTGIVSFLDSTINDSLGNGIQILSNAGLVVLGDANLTNELANGLNIQNNSGVFSGQGSIRIDGATSDAINIKNNLSTSQVNFASTSLGNGITISNRLARGVNIEDNAGTVSFTVPVTITAAGDLAVAAIDFQGSSGDTTFQNITIGSSTVAGSGGGRGIYIHPSATGTDTGRFTVFGTTNIFNTINDGITITDVDSIVAFNGSVIVTDRSRIGIEVLSTRGNVDFNGQTIVTNLNLFSDFPGVDVRGNSSEVTFQTLTVNGAQGPPEPGFGGVGVNIGGTGAADANPGAVSITTLNVNSIDGIALYANNVGIPTTNFPTLGLSIAQGNILTTNQTAVDLENSVTDVVLTSVTSTDSPTTGITLINLTSQSNTTSSSALDSFTFTVTGVNGGGVGSGGTISNAGQAGILIQNTNALTSTYTNINSGSASFSLMRITGNANGISATNTLRLVVDQSELSSNTNNGLTGVNIAEVDISNTLFNSNGAGVLVSGTLVPSGNAINLSANSILPTVSPTSGTYIWNIFDNSTINGINAGIFSGTNSADAVVITNTNRLQDPLTGLVTPLSLTFQNNNVVGPSASTGTVLNSQNTKLSGLAINWVGPESGSINLNTFTLNGNQNGITIQNTDTTYLTNFQILGNTFNGTDGGNIGLYVNNLGPTDLDVGNFIASNGTVTAQNFFFSTLAGSVGGADTAMQFTAGTNSNLNIFSNTITMTSDGDADRAIVFQFLQAPTTVLVSNNLVSVSTGTTAFNGQGISFVSSNGVINLGGQFNNSVTINGSSNQATGAWMYVAPAADTTGTFRVNNFSVP